MTRRLLAVAALTVGLAAPLAPASADLRDDCWDTINSFRVSALVCTKIPGGVG